LVIPHNTVILNNMMEVSPSDIAKQLKHWSKKEGEGNAVLDAYAFHALLDDIGYGCRDGLFDGLLANVKRTTLASLMSSSTLSRADNSSSSHGSRGGGDRVVMLHEMFTLYSSESYHLPTTSSFNNGEALMEYVMHLFGDWDVDIDNGLGTGRLGKFLFDMFDGRRLMDDKLSKVIKKLDANGDGMIDIEKFKSMILKANDNDYSKMNRESNEVLFPLSPTTNDTQLGPKFQSLFRPKFQSIREL
jgi:Ca2+-binding EF-hand superfamily protein